MDSKLTKRERENMLVLLSPCMKVQYNYMVTSMSEDTFITSLRFDQIAALERLLPERDSSRQVDVAPASLPVSESGFDVTYNLAFVAKPSYVMDVIVQGTDIMLFKVLLFSYSNPSANLQVYLYKNQSDLDPPSTANSSIAKAVQSFDERVLFALLPAQKKPYRLKLVYDHPPSADDTFMMRTA